MIALDHVHKAFGSFVAVEEANLEIARGEFFSLLGPSGCGKTTTLRMIAGFEHPTRGRILLDGLDVTGTPPYRRQVNTVFQQYALFPHLDVLDNVAFGPMNAKVPKAEARRRAAAMLEVVRLGELAHRRPAQLSGGQQQRVALARALVNLPKALLLDEPLAALDLKLRHAMQVELKRIQREVGITFVFVTHDQTEALTMSDRIAVMSHGRIEQIGTPEEIYQRPATVFVAGFIGSANLLPATVESADGGRRRCRLGDGTIVDAVVSGPPSAVGDPATVLVRPERVSLLGDAPAGSTGLRASVTEILFQGPVIRALLRTDDGTILAAEVPADADGSMLRPGDIRWARWAPDAAVVLAGAPERAGASDADVDHVEASL